MAEDATRQYLPTVLNVASKLALAALQERDVNTAPILRRAGLSASELKMRGRISIASQGKFLEFAAEALDDSALGLHLGERANPKEVGLLFYAMSAARNVAEALALLSRYTRVVNDSVRLKLIQGADGAVLEAKYVGFSRHQARQFTEFGFAVAIKMLREIARQNIRPVRVTCLHVRNTDLREFERYFGCAVEFGALSDSIVIANETLTAPVQTHDPFLLDTLLPFCEEAMKARSPAGTIRAAVENEIQRLLPHGQAQAETVATALALSARTLARRLAEEKTNFAEVVDQLRRNLAVQYLKEPGVTLAQVAYLLGYEGVTSFNHAFKRWTGKTPSAARKECSPLS